MSDATIRMEKKGEVVTYTMMSPTITITMIATAEATPEHINDMVDEFPDAVYTITKRAMADAGEA